ncbi:S1/P1 nuclease [Rhizobium leguminosarum]
MAQSSDLPDLSAVGDVHQPLHAVTLFDDRFTKIHEAEHEPDTGDRGGNEINVIPANGTSVNLHAYWDSEFGGYSTVFGALFDGFDTKTVDGVVVSTPNIPAPPADKAAISDPSAWAQESFELAKAYACDRSSGPRSVVFTGAFRSACSSTFHNATRRAGRVCRRSHRER